MNLDELVTYTRFIISEATADIWSDAELVNYLNRGYFHAYRTGVAQDRGYGIVPYDWSSGTHGAATDQGKSNYWTIRIPPWIYRVVDVQDTDKQYERIPWKPRTGSHLEGEPSWHFIGSNTLGLIRTSAPTSIRLWVYRNPAPLHSGTAGAPTTTTFVATAQAADAMGPVSQEYEAYLGALFQLTNGTFMGYVLNCSTYDRATKTVTFDPSLTTIGSGDAYAMVPDLESAHHELICYLAADRAFNKEANVAGKQLIQNTLSHLWREFITSGTPRQTQVARFVNDHMRYANPKSYYDISP